MTNSIGEFALHAEEVWCLAKQCFSAAHRALWHLAHLRLTVTLSDPGGDDPVHIACARPHPRVAHGPDAGPGTPCPLEWRISTRTRVAFACHRYHFVISLDLSPSVSVVDTSFKGFSTGTYLLDSLLPCLEDTFRLLLAEMRIGQAVFEPELYVTVLAQGSPALSLHLLERAARLHADTLQGLLRSLRAQLAVLVDRQAAWLQSSAAGDAPSAGAAPAAAAPGPAAPFGGGSQGAAPGRPRDATNPRVAASASRNSPQQPGKTRASDASAGGRNDLDSILRNCLLALSMCSVPEATSALVLLTDGVMCSMCNALQFDGVLMHLSALDVALHIVQIGGGFAPWSALGMCSDLDLLHFLVSSTPGGVLFQDHHVSSMLSSDILEEDLHEAAVAPYPIHNRLQRAWLWRDSALSIATAAYGSSYSRGSFLSSLADRSPTHEDPDEQSYVDHLKKLGCKVPPKYELDGLDEDFVLPPQTPTPLRAISRSTWMSGASSPAVNPVGRKPSIPLGASPSGYLGDLDVAAAGGAGEEPIALLEAGDYALPGSEASGLTYYNDRWTPWGVSLAQLIECRAREGFRLRFVDHRAGTSADSRLELQFALVWKPMFMILYTVEVSRPQDVHQLSVRIQSRSPSPEYLKHRGVRSNEIGEHQAQLDAFMAALKEVDLKLARICEVARSMPGHCQDPSALAMLLDPSVLHRWFSVRRLECTVGGTALELDDLHRKLANWASRTLVEGRRYWRTFHWSAFRNRASDGARPAHLGGGLLCHCCAPDGVPAQCVPSGALIGLGSNRPLPGPLTSGLPPCCVIDVTQINDDSASVVVGLLGLCPHAESALLASLASKVVGSSGRHLLGCPWQPHEEAPSFRPLGRPGVLAAILPGPPAATAAGRSKAIRVPRSGTEADLSRALAGPEASKSQAEHVDCAAMDGLGANGGSFFTFTPDWQHLKECLPHWSWRDMFKISGVAEMFYLVLQQLRADEGWCCMHTSQGCCYVKQLPLRPLETESGWRAPSRPSPTGTQGGEPAADAPAAGLAIPAPASAGAAPGGVCHLTPVEADGACLFRLVPAGPAAEEEGEPQAVPPSPRAGAPAPDSRPPTPPQSALKPREVTLPGFPAEEYGPGATSVPKEAAAHAEQRPAGGGGGAGSHCTMYYHVRVEANTTWRRSERRNVVATLWIDAPPGTLDLSALQQPALRKVGPLCKDVLVPVGAPVALDWSALQGVRALRATAAPCYLQWPARVELRFHGEDGELLQSFVCDSAAEASEAQFHRCPAPLDIAKVTACSVGGPAVLRGIEAQTAQPESGSGEFETDPFDYKVSAEDFGAMLAAQVASQDAFAAAAMTFVECLSTREDMTRVETVAPGRLRAASEPVSSGLHFLLQMSSQVETNSSEPRVHTLGRSLCGLMRCVQRQGVVQLPHSAIAPGQREGFLAALERTDVMQRRDYFGNEEYPGVEMGHYFFSLQHLRGRLPSSVSLHFSVVFVPAAPALPEGSLEGPLEVCISDGNLESLHPPPLEDPLFAAVLSKGGAAEPGGKAVDKVSGVEHLSKRSKELAARVEEVHRRKCAEAVHHQLRAGCTSLKEEVSAALEACRYTTAVLPVGELTTAAAQLAGASEVARLCEHLDAAFMRSLQSQRFQKVRDEVTWDPQGFTWLCFYCPWSAEDAAKPPPVCFVQIAGVGKAVPTDRDLHPPAPSAALFRAALDHELSPEVRIEELRVSAYYLPHEGSHPRNLRPLPGRRNPGHRNLRWDGWNAFAAWDGEVAECVLRLGEALASAVHEAHADLLRFNRPLAAPSVLTFQRVFGRLCEGVQPAEYTVTLDTRETANLGLQLESAGAAWREGLALTIAKVDQGLVSDWNQVAGTQRGEVVEAGDRIVDVDGVAASTGSRDVDRLAKQIQEACKAHKKLTLKLQKAAAAHTHREKVPLARPKLHAKAHKMLVAELQALSGLPAGTEVADQAQAQAARVSPRGQPLAALRQVSDLPGHAAVFVWADPCGAAGLEARPGEVVAVDHLAAQPAWQQATGCRPAGPRALSRQNTPVELPRPGDEEAEHVPPPPFWALAVLQEAHDGKEPFMWAQLQLLFTPMFWSRYVAAEGRPPSPEPYIEVFKETVRVAANRANQKLLLEQMGVPNVLHLSELLHPELRDDAAAADDDLTPFAFLAKAGKMEEEDKAEEKASGAAAAAPGKQTPSSPGHSASTPGVKEVVKSQRSGLQTSLQKRAARARVTTEEQDDAEAMAPPEDQEFKSLLHSQSDLDCPLQGVVRVGLVPCLHPFRIISWLGGSEAEDSKGTSAKVSFQRQKNAQLNEVVSVFAKSRLRTNKGGVWLLIPPSGESNLPLFARPRYERGADGHSVLLLLHIFGITPLSSAGQQAIERRLEAQLEKLAIVKLQLHTLDRQQTPALRGAVLDFLRPPGADPNHNLLLAVPPIGRMLHYAQFVRRALLGLLEPSSEAVAAALRSEDSGEVGLDEKGAAAAAGGPSRHHHGVQAVMSFVYKRRHVDQVITDVRQYGQRGPQRRDKVSEKVLQFQGRVGDGVAFVQLLFISPETGRVMEELAEAGGPDAPDWPPADGGGGGHGCSDLHEVLDPSCIARQAGRFERIRLDDLGDRSGAGGYLLFDMWNRAMDADRAKELQQDIRTSVDQALREYRLQSLLRHSELLLETTALQEPELSQHLHSFQDRAVSLLDEMEDQHLSSLFTHNLPEVPVGPTDVDPPGYLPPWAFMKTVEGLFCLMGLLGASSDGQRYDCMVTAQPSCPTSASEVPESSTGERHWIDINNAMWSFQLLNVCRGMASNRDAVLDAGSLLDYVSRPHEPSPCFTFMWGPTMASWGRRRGQTQPAATRTRDERLPSDDPPEDGADRKESGDLAGGEREDDGEQPRDVGALASHEVDDGMGFVRQIAFNRGLLPRRDRHRLEQHRVESGGAAFLKKHILDEWREADNFLKSAHLSAPFLAITIDARGAKIRGICIESATLLRVQTYLQSQFLWVWARLQLLRDMCACELGRPPFGGGGDGGPQLQLPLRRGLCDHVKREFPWVFGRPALPGEQAINDDKSVEESAHSVVDHEQSLDEASPYLIFGFPRAVVDLMAACDLVPDPGDFFGPAPSEGSASAAVSREASTAIVDTSLSFGSTQTGPGHGGGSTSSAGAPRGMDPYKFRHLKSSASVASGSLVDATPSEPQGLPSSSGAAVESCHRLTGGGFSRRTSGGRGANVRSLPESHEASLREIETSAALQRQDSASLGPPDLKDVLLGEPLITNALAGPRHGQAAMQAEWQQDGDPHGVASADAGADTQGAALSGCAVLRDPLALLAKAWLEQADRRMKQHRLKNDMEQVLEEWQQQGIPLTGWARQALAAHEAEESSDDVLLDLSEALEKRMPRQSRLALQDANTVEAEALILSVIHKYAVSLAKPFVEQLYISGPDVLGHAVLHTGLGSRVPSQPQVRRGRSISEAGFEEAANSEVVRSITSRTCSLSEKLCQAAPLLTVRQRFLSGLLDAFTRAATSASSGDGATPRWRLVFCLENPLPWQGRDVLEPSSVSTNGVLMRPQTLLLHRNLSQAPGRGIMAEVSCRSDNAVRIEVFGQGEKCSESLDAAMDFLASIRDFCFDFQLRSVVDSYRPQSHGYMWEVVRELLQGDAPKEELHPERARNLLVHGEMPARKLLSWLGCGGPEGRADVTVPSGVKARHLVSAMHANAAQYGFDCEGQVDSPLLALSSRDHCFARLVRERASAAGLCSPPTGACGTPVAQGLQCVLFARPFASDAVKPPADRDSVSGELGFRYAAVLLDSAWCTPASAAAVQASPHHGPQWASLAEALRHSVEEALTLFGELAAANLVAMRRLNALWRYPQQAKARDLEEVLGACRFHADLSMGPSTRWPIRALLDESEQSTRYRRLCPYLKEAFRDRCCERQANLRMPADVARVARASGRRAQVIDLPPRHLFIVTVVGAPSSVHAEERHYIILHLAWNGLSEALEGVWLHSSSTLPGFGDAESADPDQSFREEAREDRDDGGGLLTYRDELPLSMTGWDEDAPFGQQPRARDQVEEPAAFELDAGPPSGKVGPKALGENAEAVRLLVERFTAMLIEFALRGRLE